MKVAACAATLALVLLSYGCKKAVTPANDQPLASAATPSPTPAPTAVADDAVRKGLPEVHGQKLQTAYYDYQVSTVREDAKAALTADAEILKSNPTARVRLEGNCDERGSTQYNVALGQRRADAARDYLVSLGVKSSHLTVTSYGKERPADPGHDDAAWARNRRVELTVTGGKDLVSSNQ